ncbi:MAG: signal peptide peptidase SppA [Cyanobacteria bacterium J06638_20]
MGAFIRQVLATLIGLVLFVTLGLGGLIMLVVLASLTATEPEADVERGTVLTLDLAEGISDANIEEPVVLVGDLFGGATPTRAIALRVAIDALYEAAEDNRIEALYIKGSLLEGVGAGYATLRELRAALDAFQESGKPIYAHSPNWSERDLYLVSGADQVMLDPTGLVEMDGLIAETPFFAGALEQFGIGIQVIRAGSYKSGGESFVRQERSPEDREQTEALLVDLWDEVVTTVAAGRELEPSALQAIADQQGFLVATEAEAAGLIDRQAFEDEVLTELQSLTEADDLDDLNQISLLAYANTNLPAGGGLFPTPTVALVYLDGNIVSTTTGAAQIGSDRTVELLRNLREDEDVAAVVLRINSGGGSASASERITREVALLQAAKPTIATMGNIAASGGYQIAAPADQIFASPNTITGSIGVFGVIPNIEELASNNGITWDRVQTGDYAGLNTLSRPKTPEELARLQTLVDQVYDSFLAIVAEGRSMSREELQEIAQGRVWSGVDAQEIGLVDELGGMGAAVDAAVEHAELGDNWQLVEYPQPPTFPEILATLSSQRSPLADVPPPLATLAEWVEQEWETLQAMDDPRHIYTRILFIPKID